VIKDEKKNEYERLKVQRVKNSRSAAKREKKSGMKR
jgi:hypothetical protein